MMDMGLDDIIKSKKKGKNFVRRIGSMRGRGGGGRGRGGGGRGLEGGGGGKPAQPQQPARAGGGRVVDARLKIIAKNRAKMRDARDRLIQIARSADARTRISPRAPPLVVPQAGERRGGVQPRAGFPPGESRAALPRRTVRNHNAAALTFSDRRDRMLYRTVKNAGGVAGEEVAGEEEWGLHPSRLQVHLHNSAASLPHLALPRPPLRSNMCSDDSWLRPGPIKQTVYRGREDVKSRLEPVRGGGGGQQMPGGQQAQHEGYRIVVSNLQPTVTHEDIKELFEDIGVLVGSRVVRPGTAEVVYKMMEDALAAVDTYHNRQLDGQPMKCMLVKPSNVSGKGLSGTKGSIVPDLHAIHKALFNK